MGAGNRPDTSGDTNSIGSGLPLFDWRGNEACADLHTAHAGHGLNPVSQQQSILRVQDGHKGIVLDRQVGQEFCANQRFWCCTSFNSDSIGSADRIGNVRFDVFAGTRFHVE